MKHLSFIFLLFSFFLHSENNAGANCWTHGTPVGSGNSADVNLMIEYQDSDLFGVFGFMSIVESFGRLDNLSEYPVVGEWLHGTGLHLDLNYKPRKYVDFLRILLPISNPSYYASFQLLIHKDFLTAEKFDAKLLFTLEGDGGTVHLSCQKTKALFPPKV